MKNKFLLLATAFVLSTPIFAANQSRTPDVGMVVIDKSNDMENQVKQYMESQGIKVVFVTREAGTPNYLVKDCVGYWYRVYVIDGYIGGWDQVDL